jgi:hypothetical protein
MTQTEVQLVPSDSQLTANPVRPRLGSRGKPASVYVNIFPITQIKQVKAWHYDVSFGLDETSSKRLPSRIRRKLWPLIEQKFRDSAPELQRAYLAFDGTRNCFSTSSIIQRLGEPWSFDIEYDGNLDKASEFLFSGF